jgi:OOP family OmpA-OmpF porin
MEQEMLGRGSIEHVDFCATGSRQAAQRFGSWCLGLLTSTRKILVLALIGTAATLVFGAEDPEGFQTPQGHRLEKSESLRYGAFTQTSPYNCAPDWKRCNEGHVGFEQLGRPQIEGKVERADYRSEGGGEIEALLLQRNYERVIRSMGGQLYAVALGNNVGRGDIQQVFLLKRESLVQWIHLRTVRYNAKLAQLTVVTLNEVPEVLSSGELKSEMDRQGFVTLSVNFEHNKADVRALDRPLLDEVVQMLAAEPTLHISVDGHTDNVGGSSQNKQLSQRRAESIVNYLIAGGIERSRLQARGFGLESPVADNRTEDGRAKNRRVELVKSP